MPQSTRRSTSPTPRTTRSAPVDLKAKAGHDHRRHRHAGPTKLADRLIGPAKTTALCSPWDLIQVPGRQMLLYRHGWPPPDLEARHRTGWSASLPGSGRENILDGTAASANFAQPSGLATDGENLFVADSEVSGVRVITGLQTARGPWSADRGRGPVRVRRHRRQRRGVRLQHCLGWPTATASSTSPTPTTTRSRSAIPGTAPVKTFVGARKAGDSDNPPHFYEPGA